MSVLCCQTIVTPYYATVSHVRIDPREPTYACLPACLPAEVRDLLVVLLGVVVDDVVELELVNTLGGGDDAEPVTKLLLLEELLGPAGTTT